MPHYLKPTGPVAELALLTADPAEAMALATELTAAPLMSNHAFGLWGYHGELLGGEPLSVHSTGIGATAAAVVIDQLVQLGVRMAVRIDTFTPAADSPRALVVEHAVGSDGTSVALGVDAPIDADDALTSALARALADSARVGGVYSDDPFSAAARAGDRDLATAACLAIAARRELALGAVLIPDSLDSAERAELLVEIGRAAVTALLAQPLLR